MSGFLRLITRVPGCHVGVTQVLGGTGPDREVPGELSSELGVGGRLLGPYP